MDRFLKRFRPLFFAGALIASVAVIALPAWAAINLHNGLILVHNFSKGPIRVDVRNFSGITFESVMVQPGSAFAFQKCCYAAGTDYLVQVIRMEPQPGAADKPHVTVRPKLCNRNGIPYGFSEVAVNDTYVHGGGTPDHCYEGPL